MQGVSLLVLNKDQPSEELLASIEENRNFISEVVFSGKESKVSLSCPTKFLNLDMEKETKGKIKNLLVKSAQFENVLFISDSTILDEDSVEELLDEKHSTGADIVFPNFIYKLKTEREEVKNYEQPFGK